MSARTKPRRDISFSNEGPDGAGTFLLHALVGWKGWRKEATLPAARSGPT